MMTTVMGPGEDAVYEMEDADDIVMDGGLPHGPHGPLNPLPLPLPPPRGGMPPMAPHGPMPPHPALQGGNSIETNLARVLA